MAPHARAMSACCSLVRMVEGSMRHKALVRAILQVTGYRRLHVKERGLIEPRENGEFTDEFKALIEHFLEKLGCGIMFFPDKVSDDEGWEESWTYGDRYKWVHGDEARCSSKDGSGAGSSDQDRIREAMLLMFENLKDHGTTMQLDNAVTVETCLVDRSCEICAGGEIPGSGDPLLLCATCHVRRHQSCHRVTKIPAGNFYCAFCVLNKHRPKPKAKETTPKSSKKANKVESLIIDETRFGAVDGSPQQTRHTRNNPDGGFQQLSPAQIAQSAQSAQSPQSAQSAQRKSRPSAKLKTKDTPSPAPKKRLSSIVQDSPSTSKRRASSMGRSVSLGGAAALMPAFGDAGTLSGVGSGRMAKPSEFNVANAAENLRPAASFEARSSTPALSDVQSDVTSTPGGFQPDTPCVNRVNNKHFKSKISNAPANTDEETPVNTMPSIESTEHHDATVIGINAILTPSQLSKTELRIRLGPTSKINRSIRLNRIGPLENLFQACINRWVDRLDGQTPRILAYLPTDLDGVNEFTPDFQVEDFLRLVKAEWEKVDEGVEGGFLKDLCVSIILLRNGEEF